VKQWHEDKRMIENKAVARAGSIDGKRERKV